MNAAFIVLPETHRFRGVLIDTGLLLLMAAGELAPNRIPQLPRLHGFSFEHYRRLRDYIRHFRSRVTTPHILAEVSNLTRQWPEPVRSQAFGHFAASWSLLRERHTPARCAIGDSAFLSLGLTDAGILQIASQRLLVLTIDRDLTGALAQRRIGVVNWGDFGR